MNRENQLNEAFSDELGQTHHIVQGNLTISAKDHAKILRLLVNKGMSDDNIRILGEKAVDDILTTHFNASEGDIGYGLRLVNDENINGSAYVHTGSNFGMFSAFFLFPDIKSGVVVVSSGADNIINNSIGVYQICYDIAKEIYIGLLS